MSDSTPASLHLPNDVIAIESNSQDYLFYVNSTWGLSCLVGPRKGATGNDFSVFPIKDDGGNPIKVSEKAYQLAAVSWISGRNTEIRVYFASKDKSVLTEIHKSNDGPWTKGDFTGKHLFAVRENSSISATVTRDENQSPIGIKVYASKEGEMNRDGLPNISLFQLKFKENLGKWQDPVTITSEVKSY